MNTGKAILNFLYNLNLNIPLPLAFDVLDPFDKIETKTACDAFYGKYYNDDNKRHCIIGINPGRFGAGITGIPFTDPIRLQNELHIKNDWQKKQELSSVFIYEMINAFGGPEKFYDRFYFTAVSPLGFVKSGKNINYYDDKVLNEAIKPFAINCLQQQFPWLHSSVAFCLGEGKNYNFLLKLNAEIKVFGEIIPLPHPRFIMQYKLRSKHDYVKKYCSAFNLKRPS